MAKQTHWNCQNFIYCKRGVSYENCFSSNIWSFFDAPALWAECSEPFRGKKREWLSKQYSTCPEHQFFCWKFEISTIVYYSCTYCEKQFAKTFWQTCQKCTCVHHTNILRKKVFWSFVFFWDFEEKFCALWQKKLSEVVKTSFSESRRSFILF